MENQGSIKSTAEFKATPQGMAQRWALELASAEDNAQKWKKRGGEVVDRYLDERKGDVYGSRLNLFHANVNTQLAVLFGRTPQVEVTRRFADSDDDAARVAGEMVQRHLNTDIDADDDGFQATLKYAIQDWKIPGLGVARLRYEAEFEPVPETPAQVDPETGEELAPAVPAGERKADEEVCTDYVHWRDFLWSPARTWHEVRWVAFRVEMTRDEAAKRFGEDIAKQLPMVSRKPEDKGAQRDGEDVQDAWSRISLWEIWDKDSEQRIYYCQGYDRVLEVVDDPLGLEGFFPCPRPLIANATTTKWMPRPDFDLAKDLYNEIDTLTTRLSQLEKMAKVAGCYDATFEDLGRIMEESFEGQLIGVKAWGAFAEKGGLTGAMAFLPLEAVVKAIDVLSVKRQEKIQLLYQVTGMSDILRGQASASATATEQRIKAGFASTRLQTDQDEVARFATDIQRMRAEIMSKHFDPQTLVERSNVMRTQDGRNPQLVEQAVELVKSDLWNYRITVRPESISLPDLAAQKQDGVEFLQALGAFMQAFQPVAMAMPGSTAPMLQMLKWAMARFRGASTIEGVLDKAIDQAEKAAQMPKPPAPPDPRLMAEQAKAQSTILKAKVDAQQTMLDARVSQAEHQMEMQKMGMEMKRDAVKAAQEMAQPPQPFKPLA